MNRVLLEKLTVPRLLNKFPALNGTRLMQRKITRFLMTVVSLIQCTATATCCKTGELGFDYRQGQQIYLSSSTTRPALGRTQPPVRQISGAVPRGKAAEAILTTRSYLEGRLNMCAASMPRCTKATLP
jgi:hypothetical protein